MDSINSVRAGVWKKQGASFLDRAILDALIARGFAPPRAAIRLPRAKLIFNVLRNLF